MTRILALGLTMVLVAGPPCPGGGARQDAGSADPLTFRDRPPQLAAFPRLGWWLR
jgi:hypothetical protein